ncbi:hypothetical protein C9J48_13830 [Photobacterium profundum]|uniref:Uncharacterized protein n=1 Tax=Photobacterium profundum 3TCK TaxID=314280 RepID=Q1Z6C8_9GAMM|nr:hypothetical protein [Photobacterium profundum]EAS44219.1 hypothetical protein P3TCK_11068 [Photobacterium profundum 3TCK]PSV62052.1 hypothetical protein C9J48_13830 [Photobacterium profundum]
MTTAYISKYDSVMDLVSIDKSHSVATDKCSIHILEYSRLRIIGVFYSDNSTLGIDQVILGCPFKSEKVKEFSFNSCVVGKYIESNIFKELKHAQIFTRDEYGVIQSEMLTPFLQAQNIDISQYFLGFDKWVDGVCLDVGESPTLEALFHND